MQNPTIMKELLKSRFTISSIGPISEICQAGTYRSVLMYQHMVRWGHAMSWSPIEPVCTARTIATRAVQQMISKITTETRSCEE